MLGTTSLWALARVHPDDAALRREAGEQLIARLKDQDAFVRAAAARALAALPPAPEIMAPLWEKAFQDADEMTVLHALDALVATGPQAVPRLINALKHEKIRVHVIRILGKMGPAAAPAAESLANLVADKNERVSEEAAMALGGIGPGAKAAVPALIEALQQGDSPNAHAIVYALGKIGPDAAAAEPVLDDLLKRSSNLSLVNAWALTRICPPSEQLAAKTVPLLVAGLADSFPPVRHGAAEALGNLGPAAKPALPALQAALNDKDEGVRSAAAKAIAAIRGNPQEQ
jgi:HEAT repeat protein